MSLSTICAAIQDVERRMGESQLAFGHGCADAFDEAVWLVACAIDIAADRIDPESDAPLDSHEQAQIENLLESRMTDRTPLAYLVGEAWLQGRRFLCDQRALVPRSPIAELLACGLAPWIQEDLPPDSILDLCTGGGSLAILAAQAFPGAQVTASDISRPALDLAAENCALFELEERLSIVHGSLWEPLEGRTFDLIICNPPYVDSLAMSALPVEWRHEPTIGLAGDLGIANSRDGLGLIRLILAGAAEHLTERGLLVLEIGHQAAALEAAFPRLPLVWLPVAAGDQMIVLLERSALLALACAPGRPLTLS